MPAAVATNTGNDGVNTGNESRPAQPTPPAVAAAPVNERRTVPQKDTDAPAAQLAPNGGKEVKTLPLRKHTKTNTSVVASILPRSR
jgi:hypothetical protein